MSMRLDKQIEKTGTRFRIFPQPRDLEGFAEPETIVITVPPDKIQPGPADDRMYVIDAIDKQRYEFPYLPPHTGAKKPPVNPDPQTGHYDHLDPDSRDFQVAQMYATVRRTLDIWQDYFGGIIDWHFALTFSRMELIPLLYWTNAHSGYGFLEFGYASAASGSVDLDRPYCMNFDVLAHEFGHSIIYSRVGIPAAETDTAEYAGHHEAAGDLVAVVTALHSELVVKHLLDKSSGNLFTVNELSRIGDLGASSEIRRAFNYERMSTVGLEEHDLSMPLTGAIFDILVEVFQKELARTGMITPALAKDSFHGPNEPISDDDIQAQFDQAYAANRAGFRTALLTARDYLGTLLAKTWDRISPHHLTYAQVGLTLLAVDREMTGGAHQDTIRECFAWREIEFPSDSIALRSHRVREGGRRAAHDAVVREGRTIERTKIAASVLRHEPHEPRRIARPTEAKKVRR